MKVKYKDREYVFEGDLDCNLFKVILDGKEDEVTLTLYEDVFLMLLNNTLNLDDIKKEDYKYINNGLSYFGSKYNLYEHIKKKITFEKTKKLEDYILNNITLYKDEEYEIALNPLFDEKFIIRYINRSREMDCGPSPYFWTPISKRKFSEDFFTQYKNCVSWTYVCRNTSLSENFFEKHIKKVEWLELVKNKNISVDFFKRHDKYSIIENSLDVSIFNKNIENELDKLFK